MKKQLKHAGNITLVTAALLVAINLGGTFSGNIAAKESNSYENLKLFADVLSVVQRNYVEDVDSREAIYSAINGMLTSLDPHSSFMPPDAFKEMQVETKGSFGGVGIEITMKEGILTVISPIEDTPAFNAGIKAEDIIIKIDGEITKGMTIMEAVKKMRGKKGSKVVLSIARKNEKELIDFPIVRDIIKIRSVKYELLDNSYGYLRVTQFQERSTKDLKAALKEMEKLSGGLKGLILDLRNNPGGLLNQAVHMSDIFLSSGLIVYTNGRLSSQQMEFKARDDGTEPKYPVMVLVNAGSASASEIVAGALQDTGRGVILGTKTFGKGSVQTILPLDDGSGIRITTARYYTPKGRSIQAEGIVPDIVVELAPPAPSNKKNHVIREKDLKGHMFNGNGKEEEKEDKKDETPKEKPAGLIDLQKDNQAKTALDMLKSWAIFKKGIETSL